jgi:cell division protein ZapA
MDTQSVLLQLNIADDYFKAKNQINSLEEEIQAREKDLYDLKHELISAQIRLETAQKQVKDLQTELNENAKKIITLEAKVQEGSKSNVHSKK